MGLTERIKIMLQAEGDTPEYDEAGIVDPRAVEANIRKKVLQDILKKDEVKE